MQYSLIISSLCSCAHVTEENIFLFNWYLEFNCQILHPRDVMIVVNLVLLAYVEFPPKDHNMSTL